MSYTRDYIRLKTPTEFENRVLEDLHKAKIFNDKPNQIKEICKSAREVANIYGYTVPKEIKNL